MIKKILSGMGTGVMGFVAGIFALILLALSFVSAFAVPALIVAFLFHLGPFHHDRPASSTSSLCSTLNEMTAYSTTHHKINTPTLFLQSITYSNRILSKVKPPPPDIRGTISSAVTASNQLIILLEQRLATGSLTASQAQKASAELNLWEHTSKTITNWYNINC